MMHDVPESPTSGEASHINPRIPVTLDPELAAMHVLMPRIDVSDFAVAREIEWRLSSGMGSTALTEQVDVQDVSLRRTDGSDLQIRIYRPTGGGLGKMPLLLFIHGGSFVTGGLHTEDTRCAIYAHEASCAVVAVDYRLAPEHPFPAGLTDCEHALVHLRDHADVFEVDVTRLAVGGLSAGGALASGVAARWAEAHSPRLVLQLLLFPVLDASMTTPTARDSEDTPVLTSTGLRDMWRLYLGDEWAPGRSDYPRDSSPAHNANLASLPPTYLCTAGLDPLRDEVLQHARRLLDAGIQVDLHHYGRGFHSFDSFHFTRLGRRALDEQVEVLRAVFT